MGIKIFATFFAPLLTSIIVFFLNKYYSNKPRLIAYYGHISAHIIQNNKGYQVNILSLDFKPSLNYLNSTHVANVPLIIKWDDEIWIYGHDSNSNSNLIKSTNPKAYDSILFKKDVTTLNKISDEIYDDILNSSAHYGTMYVGTHAVVVRNSGKISARNIRLGHKYLSNFTVFPEIQYEISDLPSGGKEIIIPTLVPNEQITISYLYFTNTYNEINTYVKSDEGFAKIIDVIPAPNLPGWQKFIIWTLLCIGCATVIYFLTVILFSLLLKGVLCL